MMPIPVFRGQSNGGLGEGIGKPVSYGEQFLDETDRCSGSETGGFNEITENENLLSQARPWMTLDASHSDHQRLGGQLESWTYFTLPNYYCVVRLIGAGNFDRRPAYFAHGWFWKKDTCGESFDPGVYLGWSNGFDQPWKKDQPCQKLALENPPAMGRYREHAKAPSSKSFLAHFFQALEENYPLIIAAPLDDFKKGNFFYSQLSFARAALPAHLKLDCTMQIFSRSPENLLRRRQVNITVLPEDVASDALSVLKNAVLLDREGVVKFSDRGQACSEKYSRYSELVVEEFLKAPDCLFEFCRLFSFFFNGDKKEKLPHTIEEQVRSSFRYCRLVNKQSTDWGLFIREEILSKADYDSISPRFISLVKQKAVLVDPYVDDWWEENNEEKLNLILSLFNNSPFLISPGKAVGLCKKTDPSILLKEKLGKKQAPGFLVAAFKNGDIRRWGNLPKPISELAKTDPDLCSVLLDATVSGNFDLKWIETFVKTSSAKEVSSILQKIFEKKVEGREWHKVVLPGLKFLINRSIDDDLKKIIIEKKMELPLEPTKDHLLFYLLTADLLGRQENPLLKKLAPQLSRMGEIYQKAVVKFVFENKLTNLTLDFFFKNGSLQFDWLYNHSGFLLSEKCKSIQERLSTETLLKMWGRLVDENRAKDLVTELDRRMETETTETTTTLIKTDFWFSWRQTSLLKTNPDKMREFAFSWLTSEIWSDTKWEYSREFCITMETWKQVMKDIRSGLSADNINIISKQIRARQWPWITFFKAEQVKDLAILILDKRSIAVLSEGLAGDTAVGSLPAPSPEEFIYENSVKIKKEYESAVEDAITALSQGDSDHGCWKYLEEWLKDAPSKNLFPHPLVDIREKVTTPCIVKYPEIKKKGWETMKEVLSGQNHTFFLKPHLGYLPIFTLAASISSPGNLISLSHDIIGLLPEDLPNKAWLASLFRSAENPSREGGEKSCDDRGAFLTLSALPRCVPPKMYIAAREVFSAEGFA